LEKGLEIRYDGDVFRMNREHIDLRLLYSGNGVSLYQLGAERVLKVAFMENKNQAKRSMREIKLWSSLKHPNIVEFLGIVFDDHDLKRGAFSEDGNFSEVHLSILMKRYDETLHEYLLKERKLSLESRLLFLLQIAEGLNYLHRDRKIIHQDLHVKNVLVKRNLDSRHAQIGIIDFGLSKILDVEQKYIETGFESTFSENTSTTGHIQPPESYENAERKGIIGFFTDIFAFGFLIWQVFSSWDIRMIEKMLGFGNDDKLYKILQRLSSETVSTLGFTSFKACLLPHHGIFGAEASDDLIRLMKDCLQDDYTQRPSASNLVERISELRKRLPKHLQTERIKKDEKEEVTIMHLELQKGTFEGGVSGEGYIHGQGTFLFPDGSKFSGKWRFGQRIEGSFIDPRGNIYHGPWYDDEPCEHGFHGYTDGQIYEGRKWMEEHPTLQEDLK
jgi:serine/threonine protein kinase